MSRLEIETDEHGFPIHKGVADHDADSQEQLIPNRRVERRPTWFHAGWVRALLFLAFIGCVVFFGFGREIGPWFSSEMAGFFARRAFDKEIENDLSGALADANNACQWQPDDLDYLMLRGHFRLKNGDPQGAYEDFDRIVKKRPREPESYTMRAYALARLNRFDDAFEDMTIALDKAGETDASTLNSRAYLCALGNMNLEQGLADIELAIEQGNQHDAAFLDTRGYLHFLLGNLPAAEKDLDQAILLTQIEQSDLRQMQNARFIDPRELKYRLRRIDENLAVMHYHRGELYEKLDRESEAASEKALGLQLGYDRERGIY